MSYKSKLLCSNGVYSFFLRFVGGCSDTFLGKLLVRCSVTTRRNLSTLSCRWLRCLCSMVLNSAWILSPDTACNRQSVRPGVSVGLEELKGPCSLGSHVELCSMGSREDPMWVHTSPMNTNMMCSRFLRRIAGEVSLTPQDRHCIQHR